VRRVFASASSAPAYAYDPYGNALQGTAPLTDFNYAGMFYNADSGLYLTQYRAYDPVAARWLSRDPIGEVSDIADSTTSTVLFKALGLTRTFAASSAGLLTGNDYNPYRDPPRTLAPLSEYPSTLYNTELYLRQQSAYGAVAIPWVSSNPNGEISDIATNLYLYVYDNPIGLTDPTGEGALGNFIRACGIAVGILTGGQAIGTRPPPPITPRPPITRPISPKDDEK
jgi:RHS repeat-associated protein